MTKLSVNINKIALLRNSRGNDYPNVITMANRCINAGAHGITVHPRQDQRHIKYSDVPLLSKLIKDFNDSTGRSVEFNIEGYPSEEFLNIIKRVQPDQCTLVPDDPNQLTSDHGWDLQKHGDKIQPIIHELQNEGIRVSLFMDPDPSLMKFAKEVETNRIELYTESYARAYENVDDPSSVDLSKDTETIFLMYKESANTAHKLGLGINAGHDLNLKNLAKFLFIDHVLEVSIGHAIVVESFDYGWEPTIKRYLEIINRSERSSD